MGRPPVHDRSVSAALAAPPPPMCVIRRAARWAVSTLKTEADGGRWEWINIKVKKMDLRFVQGCLGRCRVLSDLASRGRGGPSSIRPLALLLFSIPCLFSSCCSCFRPFPSSRSLLPSVVIHARSAFLASLRHPTSCRRAQSAYLSAAGCPFRRRLTP